MKALRFLAIALSLLLVGCVTLTAQAKGTLTVQANVSGSQVYLDGRLVGNATPTFTLSIPVRNYALRVSHAGYQDFNTSITVPPAGVTVQANLIPIGQVAPPPPPAPSPLPSTGGPVGGKYSLTITANVPGAGVLVNGAIVGKVPYTGQYVPGTYRVTVRWGGYNDYNQTVVLNGNVQVNAILTSGQPAPPPPASQYPLSVNANVQGAAVIINGNTVGSTPFNTLLLPGNYNVTVRLPGYNDYNQSLFVNGPSQVNAMLQPIQAGLSVTANVPNAEVFINGNRSGRVPFSAQLVPGSYNVTVKAPGYNDYNQSVVVNGPTQVNAMLTPNQASLSVTANVQNADVYINGNPSGRVPLSIQLAPGSYTVVVKAQGYGDYSQSLVVNGPSQVNAVLSPLGSGWQVSIPDGIVNKDMKGGHFSQIMIWLDGNLQRGVSGQLLPGRHVLRITSGGIATEVTFDVQAGRNYIFEPFFGITVK